MSQDFFGGVSAADKGRGGSVLPEGFYPQLRLTKAELFKQSQGSRALTFSSQVEVLEGPAKPGTVGSGPFEQLEKNQFESYDTNARARVKSFLGVLFGYDTDADADAHITSQTLSDVTGPQQPMTGSIFSARITHVVTSKGRTIQKFADIAPVRDADGKPLVIRGRQQFAAPAVTNQPAPPPSVPSAPSVPAGWAVHPNDSRYIYELANTSNMKLVG